MSDLAPPENALIFAVPDCVPAMKRTDTCPLFVSASRGSTVPNEDEKVTTVPLCTGVPACSMTTAVISKVPLVGTTDTLACNRIVVFVGASSGTLSHATPAKLAVRALANRMRVESDMRVAGNDNSCVKLGGQGASVALAGPPGGFAMAALLVGMSIMAILMGAALPVWNRQAQREREVEYLFRANEYARAVMKFRARVANTSPPNFDGLVQQRFLRRKYKDPLTGEDFQPVFQTAGALGQPAGTAPTTPGTITTTTPGTPTAGQGTPVPGAGVIGVVSKSKGTSIKIFNGRTRYDQWSVTYMDVKLGRGLPPDLLQVVNAAGRPSQLGQPGQPGRPGAGNPFGAPNAPSPGGFGQPVQPGASPFGPSGQQPFGQPLGQPGQPGAQPQPNGNSIFSPAYPPPPSGGAVPVFKPPLQRPPDD